MYSTLALALAVLVTIDASPSVEPVQLSPATTASCPTPPSLPGDFNGDGVVTNAGDLELFLTALVAKDSDADLNFDCRFNLLDLDRFYEFSSAGLTTIVDWDLNGVVNLADIQAFTIQWNAEFTTGSGTETNVGRLCDKSDCAVDLGDYQLFSIWFLDEFQG